MSTLNSLSHLPLSLYLYPQLCLLKKEFPDTPIVALTATARDKVMQDTLRILGLDRSAKIFSVGFDRPNLFFAVRQKPSSTGGCTSCCLVCLLVSFGIDTSSYRSVNAYCGVSIYIEIERFIIASLLLFLMISLVCFPRRDPQGDPGLHQRGEQEGTDGYSLLHDQEGHRAHR